MIFCYRGFGIYLSSHLNVEEDFFPVSIGYESKMIMFSRMTPEGFLILDQTHPLYVVGNYPKNTDYQEFKGIQQVQLLFDQLLEPPLEIPLDIIRAVHSEASKYSSFLKKLTIKGFLTPNFLIYGALTLGFSFPILEVLSWIIRPKYEVVFHPV